MKENAPLLFELLLILTLSGCGSEIGDRQLEPAERLPADCTAQVAPGAALSVDDFEDGDTLLPARASLSGYWYVNNDGTGTQVPSVPDGGVTTALLADEGAPDSPAHSLYTNGSGFRKWGAFVATRLNAARSRVCRYDVSASSGLQLNVKGTGTLRVNLGTTGTTPIVDGGECAATDCSDFGGVVELRPEWALVTLAFADLTQPDWAEPATWDPSQLLRLSVWSEQPEFEFWLDDVGFY